MIYVLISLVLIFVVSFVMVCLSLVLIWKAALVEDNLFRIGASNEPKIASARQFVKALGGIDPVRTIGKLGTFTFGLTGSLSGFTFLALVISWPGR